MTYIISAVIGYLLGSINAAVILTKTIFRKDVRTQGSGNAGATNVTRTFGWGAGFATLFGDMLKTFLSALIGKYVFGGDAGMCAALLGCAIGHCFPAYFHFKGGKGVSVGFALGLCIDPASALLGGLLLFLIIAFITKRVSAGSVIACACIPVYYAVTQGVNALQFPLLCVSAALIIFMHRSNIKRLINGTEPPFKAKSKKDGN